MDLTSSYRAVISTTYTQRTNHRRVVALDCNEDTKDGFCESLVMNLKFSVLQAKEETKNGNKILLVPVTNYAVAAIEVLMDGEQSAKELVNRLNKAGKRLNFSEEVLSAISQTYADIILNVRGITIED